MKRPKVGDVVRVEFQDHTLNGDEIKDVVAYGRVHSFDDSQIVIDSWHGTGATADVREVKDNTECFAIIRKTITDMTRLVPDG